LGSKAETGTSQPRGKARFAAGIFVAAILVSFVAFSFFAPSAHGNPAGGTVASGSANIVSSGSLLDVNQSTQRAVIDWRSFNIAPSETTKFSQPSSSSVTLNRINDPDPSQILGTLTANGNVILINPNGVFFGPTSKVDVNGLIATTANISNADFMAGNMNFGIPGNPDASIVNEGTITAKDAGLVGLVAPNVINSGTINTKLGHTDLGSGDTFTMDMYGDGLINVGVSDSVKKQVITNSGTVNAAGGTIQVTAAAGRKVVDSLVTIAGKLNAPTAQLKDGRIIISAAGSNAVANNVAANKSVKTGSSTVLVSGTLDASGHGLWESGGTIQVLGDNVGILSGARIDASGDTGGGTIQIGGDFHGKGTTSTALHTVVQNDTAISADAITTGNGGTVTVWADDSTVFDGTIEAKGGAQSGNGGYVETSGHNTLAMSGIVNASAPNGDAGTWLMDPNNVTITNTVTTNTGSAPNFSDTGSPANVNTTDIQTALNGGTSVNVTASGSIAVNNNITENTYNGTESLTLAAGTDITLANNVAVTASGASKLNVTLDADRAAAGGAIVMNAGSSITTNGGNIIMGGGATPLTGYAVGDAASPYGININGALNAGSGAITLNGQGYLTAANNNFGIYVQAGNTIQASGAGSITLTGIGGGTGASTADYGIYLVGTVQSTATGGGGITLIGYGGDNGGSGPSTYGTYLNGGTLTSVDGNILVDGNTGIGGQAVSSATGSHEYGIHLNGGAISSTGNAAITLNGIGAGTGASNDNEGIHLSGVQVSSVTGAISLTGTGSSTTGGSNFGIFLQNNPTVYTTGSGNITLTGVGGAGTNGIRSVPTTGTNQIGGASDTGNITLNTDTLNLTTTAIQTTGTVTFAPNTASTIIGFGSVQTLTVTQAIMDNVNAPTVIVGRPDSTGGLYTGAFTWENTLNNLYLEGGIDFIAGNITKSSGTNNATLTVISATNITQQSGDTISSSGTFGQLNTVFDADTAGAGGNISVQANIASNGGLIDLGGGALSGGLPTGAAVGSSVGGIGLSTSAGTILNAGGGNITMNGQGYSTGGRGIDIFGTLQTSGTGTISLTGAAGGTGAVGPNDYGVALENASAITTATGAITINGTGASVNTALADSGIRDAGATITSGGGAITLNGNGGAAPGSGMNISAGTIQNSGTGTISLIGTTSSGNSIGVSLSGGTITTSGTGLISLTGMGSTTNYGISLTGGSIAPTGAAPITLTGTAGSGALYGISLNPASATNLITSAGGTVTLISPTTIYLKNTGITFSGGAPYGLVFDADTALAGGEVYFDTGDALSTNGGNITMGGGALSGGLPTGAAVGLSTVGNEYGIQITTGDTVNAGGGNIAMTGTGGTYAPGPDYGINEGATIQTSGSGTISLTGTGGSSAGSSNYGINASGGSIQTSGTGTIALTGIGGGSGASASNFGINLVGTVQSTATGGGGITLIGYGGDNGGTGASNIGTYVNGGTVTSIDGNILVDGNTGISGQTVSNTTGGTSNTTGNFGIENTGTISSTGNATITLNGLGAGSVASNNDYGIYVNGAGALVTSATGNISLTGTGAATTGGTDLGISVFNAGTVQSTGAATVSLAGYGGGSGAGGSDHGVYVTGTVKSTAASSGGGVTIIGYGGDMGGSGASNFGTYVTTGTVTSISGNIVIDGNTGGSGTLTTSTGATNYGIFDNAATISTTGTATVTLNGIGGGSGAGGSDYGIDVAGTVKSTVAGGGGGITLIGYSGDNGGSGGTNIGTYINSIAGTVTSVDGNILIDGNTGITGQAVSTTTGNTNPGVQINSGGPLITSTGSATITINGIGAGSGASTSDYGIDVVGTVKSTATGGGGITLIGYGGDIGGSGGTNYGTYVNGGTVTSVDGNIVINGNTGSSGSVSTATGNSNDGIYNSGVISSTGNATIALTGIGGGSGAGSLDYGLYVAAGGNVTSAAGNISLTGTGAPTTGGTDYGVGVAVGGTVQSTGAAMISLTGYGGGSGAGGNDQGISLSGTVKSTAAGGGGITLIGYGGDSGGSGASNLGTYVNGTVTSVDGNILIDGNTGGSGTVSTTTGNNNFGIDLTNPGVVSSTGNATITLTGIGGGSGASAADYGIAVLGTVKSTVAGGGGITLIGYGGDIGGSGNSNDGIFETGTVTSVDGNILIDGNTGGSSPVPNSTNNSQYGIYDTGAISSTGNATVTMNGVGGGSGTSNTDQGVYISGTVTSTATGAINITGTGAATTGGSDYGVYINSPAVVQSTGAAPIILTGIGGGTGASSFNYGIDVAGTVKSTVAGGGGITLIGYGGDNGGSGSNNYATVIPGTVTSVSGNILIDGNTGISGQAVTTARGFNNYGVYNTAGTISTTGSATITLNGIAGGSGNSAAGDGIYNAGLIESTAAGGGGITLIGYAGDGNNGNNYATWIFGGTVSTVDGNIVIDGNTGISGQSVTTLGIWNDGVRIDASGTVSSTGLGSITITGIGSGAPVASFSNYGVLLNTSTVTSVNGNISISGTGANTTGGADYGVYLLNNPTVYTTGSGNITLTGVGGNGNTGISSMAASGINQIGGASDTGNITLNADTLSLASTPIQTNGTVTFAPFTASTTVGVAGGAGTLGVTSAILGSVTAGSLTIGNGSDTGAMTIGAYSLWAQPTSFITGSSGSITVSGAQVATGSGSFAFTGPTTLNANLTTANQNIAFNSATTLGANSTINAGTATTSFGSTISDGTYNLTLTGDHLTLGGNVSGSGTLTIQPYTASTNVNINDGTSSGLYLTGAEQGYIQPGFSLMTIGNTSDTGALTVGASTWNAPLALLNGSGSINMNGAEAMGSNSFLANTLSGNITLGASGSITSSAAGTPITLAASGGNFTDSNGSASALSATGGQWLVYSTSPASDNDGALVNSFRRFSCTYGGSCPAFPGAGNGLMYTTTPVLTATPAGLASITYGSATPSLAGYGYTLSGYLGGDGAADSLSGALNGTTTYTPASNVGTYNINYASGALASAMGYSVSYANNPAAITVTPKALTVTANSFGKTYGDIYSFLGTEFTDAGLVNGDTLTGLTLSSPGAAPTATVAGGPYSITGSAATGTGLGNYTISYVNGTLTVNPAALTITANNQLMTYGAAVPTLTASYSGFVNGETAASLTAQPGLSTTGTSASNVGLYPIGVSGAADSNYTISYVPGSLNINPAALTITANSFGKTYGTTYGFLGNEFTDAGLVNGDTVSSVNLASAGATGTATVAGGPYTITSSGAVGSGLSNYNITYNNGQLTVNPAALTVTANSFGKTYGTTYSFLGSEFTDAGLVNGDTVSSVSLTSPGAAGTATVTGGPYAISGSAATGTGLGNYTISYVNGALTVNPAALTITANSFGKTYGAAYSFLGNEFTDTGLVNSDTVSALTLASAGAAGTATVVGGPYTITGSAATGTGLGNYTISYVNGQLTVNPAALTITANSFGKTYGTTYSFLGTEFTDTGLVNGDAVTGLTLSSPGAVPTATVAGGPFAITGSAATGAGLGNYTITYNSGLMTVNPAALTIAANDQTMIYGHAFPTLTASYIGLLNGETAGSLTVAPVVSSATAASADAGTYANTLTVAGAVDSNYTIAYLPGTLTIDRAPLTITADNLSKSYGTAYNFLGTEFTAAGLVNANTVSGMNLSSPGAAAAATGGLYAITPGNATGTGLSNYTISYVDGLFIVVPVALPNTVAWTLPNAPGAACGGSLVNSCRTAASRDALAEGHHDNLDIRMSPELAAMLGY
jgi:mucin-19